MNDSALAKISAEDAALLENNNPLEHERYKTAVKNQLALDLINGKKEEE